MNKYIKNEVIIKMLKFETEKIGVETNKNGTTEKFKLKITNLNNNNSITIYNFNNSIMEYNITNSLNNKPYLNYNEFKRLYLPKFWMGYSDCANFKQLENKRIYYLLHSVINDFSNYINFKEQNLFFEDFCENYGYDIDSIKAQKIYFKCENYNQKIRSLKLSKEQTKYFLNEVANETNKFDKDLKKLVYIK